MSFHLSAEDIRIEDNHILKARLATVSGDWRDAEFDLDEVLGNQNGMIHWDGRDFSQSAHDVTFSIEGGAEVPVLRVSLRSNNGDEYSRDVNLSERIRNEDGRFIYGGTDSESKLREWLCPDPCEGIEINPNDEWWMVLDDSDLFDVGDHLERVYDVLPELAVYSANRT
ncbi:Cyanovirin-N [Tolypocladium ophioglossoides CBS 100239]|uniref:Cyanovirin-N n=1 Tax=Tolypocladium ophioglossoides (strain CBS 100239) TaxID=1163406 RepID=A0A0L0MZF8_TOLOC|nr:Cyanovirin-N [Tolypocladium ophioglossoides CBS 100239]